MYAYTVVQWLFFFYLYCFFGWCFESAYVSIRMKRPINRGFMRGPFLPLYGSGAMMLLVVSFPFRENILLTYLAGLVGATVLEYITGVCMEALFKVRYWDYSYKKIQFQGHICLSSSIAWGFLTILMTKVIHPFIEKIGFIIPYPGLTALVIVLSMIIGFDFAIAFHDAMDLRNILVQMEKAKKELGHMQKRVDVMIALTNDDMHKMKENITGYMGEVKDSIENYVGDVKDSIEYYVDDMKDSIETRWKGMKRVAKVLGANPTMNSKLFGEQLETLKREAEVVKWMRKKKKQSRKQNKHKEQKNGMNE